MTLVGISAPSAVNVWRFSRENQEGLAGEAEWSWTGLPDRCQNPAGKTDQMKYFTVY